MAIHQTCGFFGRPRGVERCLKTVLPSGGGFGDLASERGFVDGGPERGASAAQGHVQPCVVGERDLHLGLEVLGAAVSEQQAFDAQPHFGGVAVARHEHHAGPETAGRVVPHDHARGPPLVEVDRAAHEADELRHARLEELVAGPSLEHREHRLAVMARRVEPEGGHDLVDLVTDDRDLGGGGEVRGGRPKTQEPVLAHHAASGIALEHRDLVEMPRAVHGRASAGFGDVQSVACPCGGRRVHAGVRAGRRAPQDAEPAARHAAQTAALQPQALVALEDEMRAVHPVQQGDVLGTACVAPPRRRGALCAERKRRGAHAFAHRPPIIDCGRHIGETGAQQLEHARTHVRIEERVDLVQLPGFLAGARRRAGADRALEPAVAVALDLHHRVDERVHADAGTGEREADGIDEERPIVGDDQHTADGADAGRHRIRRQHLDQGLARAAPRGERGVAGRERRGFARRARGEVLFADADEVAAQQAGGRRAAPSTCRRDDAVDQGEASTGDRLAHSDILKENWVR